MIKQMQDIILQFNNHFVEIVIWFAIWFFIGVTAYNFMKKTKEEKIEIVKQQIKNILLKLVTDAEMQYIDVNKSGAIKRAKVIKEIFENYPILSKVIGQKELIAWIDEEIDNALVTLKDIIAKQ